jgi:hypothetical protein
VPVELPVRVPVAAGANSGPTDALRVDLGRMILGLDLRPEMSYKGTRTGSVRIPVSKFGSE